MGLGEMMGSRDAGWSYLENGVIVIAMLYMWDEIDD
jgi:hypothetical protein